MTGDDEANLSHRLLLTDTQVASLHKSFANKSLAKIKFLKAQLSKIIQSEGLLGRFLGPPMTVGLLLMKNIIHSLAKKCVDTTRIIALASLVGA